MPLSSKNLSFKFYQSVFYLLTFGIFLVKFNLQRHCDTKLIFFKIEFIYNLNILRVQKFRKTCLGYKSSYKVILIFPKTKVNFFVYYVLRFLVFVTVLI